MRTPSRQKPKKKLTALAALSAITDRDRRILVLLGRHQVLTTHHIARAVTGCPRVARQRLQVLEDVGLVDVFRPRLSSGTSPKHAVLTARGAMAVAGLLDAHHAAPVKKDEAVRIAARADLSHLLGINHVFCSLAAAARSVPDVELEMWWSERACARTWGALARPDGFGRWREGARRIDFFLEYDTGVENLGQVTAKLPGYAAVAAATGHISPVLFWLHSPRREDELHKKLVQMDTDVPVATATGDAAVSDASGPIWRTGGAGSARHRLIDLGRLATQP